MIVIFLHFFRSYFPLSAISFLSIAVPSLRFGQSLKKDVASITAIKI